MRSTRLASKLVPAAVITSFAGMAIASPGCIAVAVAIVAATAAHDHGTPNTLTSAEKAAGWTLLFDGKTPSGWRSYKKDSFPSKGWKIENGTLIVQSKGGGGDIVSPQQYADFELELEFKTTPKANSGIMYRVAEKLDYPWMTGPEFQVLDDAGAELKGDHPHSAGALYDLAPPAPMRGSESLPQKTLKPAGEFNHARIIVNNGRARHYLNGVKIVDIAIAGDDWTSRIAGSKFKEWPAFGLEPTGHIALQDHGDEVHFRNIKIRDLSKPMPGEVALFNGKDMAGWNAFVPEASNKHRDPISVWTVKDGVMICAGNPAGYIQTEKTYTNFVLSLEWRFNPEKGPGNSGVLLRKTGEDKVWPRSIEAQLMSGSAGDFWNIGEFPMKVDADRTKGRNTKKLYANENALGQWNHYEIIVDKGDVTLKVNGEVLNTATNAEEIAGTIALQSEGAEIHFRNIRLAEIK
jgi:hypothetical protein